MNVVEEAQIFNKTPDFSVPLLEKP